jgi:hypothetical protein
MLDFWQGLCDVYNTIPKSWEWLIVNCVVNVGRTTLFVFYIFRGSRMLEDYIKLCCNLTLEEWEDDSHTPKMGTWESTGIPETSKFDFRG